MFGSEWRRPYGADVKSLNQLKWLRLTLQRTKWLYYTKLWKMDIDRTVMFSLSAKFDRTYPKGLHIGERNERPALLASVSDLRRDVMPLL